MTRKKKLKVLFFHVFPKMNWAHHLGCRWPRLACVEICYFVSFERWRLEMLCLAGLWHSRAARSRGCRIASFLLLSFFDDASGFRLVFVCSAAWSVLFLREGVGPKKAAIRRLWLSLFIVVLTFPLPLLFLWKGCQLNNFTLVFGRSTMHSHGFSFKSEINKIK